MDRKIAQAIAVSSLIVGTVTATIASASQFSPDTASSLVHEESKSDQLFAQSQPIASQVEFLNGTWEGTYTCTQGLTKLKLVIEAKSTTEIDVVFLFSPHPQNPNVPSGSFRMKGNLEVFNSPDIPDILDLKATTWINRPSGWGTIDLRGDVSKTKRSITGNIPNSGCSTFDVVKRER